MKHMDDFGKVLFQESDRMVEEKRKTRALSVFIYCAIIGFFIVLIRISLLQMGLWSSYLCNLGLIVFIGVGIVLLTLLIYRSIRQGNRFILFEKGIQLNDETVPIIPYSDISLLKIHKISNEGWFVIQMKNGKKFWSSELDAGGFSNYSEGNAEVLSIIKNRLADIHEEDELRKIIRDYSAVVLQSDVVERLNTHRFKRTEIEIELREGVLDKGRNVITMDDYREYMRHHY